MGKRFSGRSARTGVHRWSLHGAIEDRGHGDPGQKRARQRSVVLVHGAFADGSSYVKVIPLLTAKGFRVTAVQNPLSSLAEESRPRSARLLCRIGR